MKPVNFLMALLAGLTMLVACNSVSYQKSKTGLLYKIITTGKDSVVKQGEWLKFYFQQKLNDSLLETNYGKAPLYMKLAEVDPRSAYSPIEVFNQLHKGDSLITIAIVDSLKAKGLLQDFPPFMKKGDRLITYVKIVDVLKTDSLYKADAMAEEERDRPRQMKEREEQMAKRLEMQRMQQMQIDLENEKSGEAAKGIAEIENYLKQKNIVAQKTGKGTFVRITQQGNGAQADSGKYVTVKYIGRTLEKDSVFDQGTYPLQLGQGGVIPGWEEGLKLFKAGGKGTLYVPGFRAYGRNHPQFKPFQSMIFDVEMLNVSDTMPARPDAPIPGR
jgi:FKBP-type peptidyl-prolyl cis-trans isomerase